MPRTTTHVLMALLLGAAHLAAAQIDILPKVEDSFCDQNRDFQTDESGKLLPTVFNYTLCMDVASASWSMACTQDHPCPNGKDAKLSVYTAGVSYVLGFDGTCTKHPCPNLAQCNPPSGMPFSFLELDNDARGIASLVGQVTIDGLVTDHYQHVRGPGAVMNWYLESLEGNVSRLVRDAFNHTMAGAPAGVGSRDFSAGWASPAPASSFAIPEACATAELGAPRSPAVWPATAGFGDSGL